MRLKQNQSGQTVIDLNAEKEKQLLGGWLELKDDINAVTDPKTKKVLKKLAKLALGKDA